MLEKRGYIDPNWTPKVDEEEKSAAIKPDKLEQLDNDTSKRMSDKVIDKVKTTK